MYILLFSSTKNTILKKYDGRFKDVFQEIYEKWVLFGNEGVFCLVINLLEKDGKKSNWLHWSKAEVPVICLCDHVCIFSPGTTKSSLKRKTYGMSTD